MADSGRRPVDPGGLRFQYKTSTAFGLGLGVSAAGSMAVAGAILNVSSNATAGSKETATVGAGLTPRPALPLSMARLLARRQKLAGVSRQAEDLSSAPLAASHIQPQQQALAANGGDLAGSVWTGSSSTVAASGGADGVLFAADGGPLTAEPPVSSGAAQYIIVPKVDDTLKQGGLAGSSSSVAAADSTGLAAVKSAVIAITAPSADSRVGADAQVEALALSPPWMRNCSKIASPMLRLHQEIVELCELLQPTPEEADARRAAVAAVTAVVQSIWPAATVAIFGSVATGLYVPTSDIDLVVENARHGNVQGALRALGNALNSRGLIKNLQVIAKAKVPIIKFETVEFGTLAFDISFDVANGPQAAGLVKELTGKWPMMRPLILVLKMFLQQRDLNEVYTGTIGSYALITMTTAFLQLHASRRAHVAEGGEGGEGGSRRDSGKGRRRNSEAAETVQEIDASLGVLLVDFFRFYGRVLNVTDVGVSVAEGGLCFDKDSRNWRSDERPYLLAVEDPADESNDLCRNSFNIMRVKTAFEYAYQMLTTPCRRSESLLARILRLGPVIASRTRPSLRTLVESGYYVAQPPEALEAMEAAEEARYGVKGVARTSAKADDAHPENSRKRRRKEKRQRQRERGAHGSTHDRSRSDSAEDEEADEGGPDDRWQEGDGYAGGRGGIRSSKCKSKQNGSRRRHSSQDASSDMELDSADEAEAHASERNMSGSRHLRSRSRSYEEGEERGHDRDADSNDEEHRNREEATEASRRSRNAGGRQRKPSASIPVQAAVDDYVEEEEEEMDVEEEGRRKAKHASKRQRRHADAAGGERPVAKQRWAAPPPSQNPRHAPASTTHHSSHAPHHQDSKSQHHSSHSARHHSLQQSHRQQHGSSSSHHHQHAEASGGSRHRSHATPHSSSHSASHLQHNGNSYGQHERSGRSSEQPQGYGGSRAPTHISSAPPGSNWQAHQQQHMQQQQVYHSVGPPGQGARYSHMSATPYVAPGNQHNHGSNLYAPTHTYFH